MIAAVLYAALAFAYLVAFVRSVARYRREPTDDNFFSTAALAVLAGMPIVVTSIIFIVDPFSGS